MTDPFEREMLHYLPDVMRFAGSLERDPAAAADRVRDTYLHWAIADAPLSDMPNTLKSLEIPFNDLITLSEAVVANREKIRPKVRARRVLERVTLTMTFQSSSGVEKAMLMLGIRNAFKRISGHIQPQQAPAEPGSAWNSAIWVSPSGLRVKFT